MPRLVANDKTLPGGQFQQFFEAVLDAYDDVNDLTRVLKFGVDQRLTLITSDKNPLDDVVYDIISKADTEGWSAELLQALRATRPTNQRLLVFAQQFELAPASPDEGALQALIQKGDPLLDVVGWRTALGESESRVCRIERDGAARGTGFLLGPSVVMTNHHVVADVVGGSTARERMRLRFDYKVLADGLQINPGNVYELAADWDIAHSPHSPLDTEVNATGVPGKDKLDYALLRVEGAPGAEPAAGVKGTDPKGPPRGFVPIPPGTHDWRERKDVMILQHADGQPLKLAMRSDGVTETRPAGKSPTRVRYSTRTEEGSSGSPCFDFGWNLIALHHSGDPKYAKLNLSPDWNEGIPLAAILDSLDDDVRAQLGAGG